MPPKKRKFGEALTLAEKQRKKLRGGGNYLEPEFELYHGDPSLTWEHWRTIESIRKSRIFDVVLEDDETLPIMTRNLLRSRPKDHFIDPMLAYYILNMAILFIGVHDRRQKDKYRDLFFKNLGLLDENGNIIIVDTTNVAPSTWHELISSAFFVVETGIVTSVVHIYFGNKFPARVVINQNTTTKMNDKGIYTRYGYLRLKVGLYSSHLTTYSMMPMDFWDRLEHDFFDHYFRICERYVIQCDKYTFGYVQYLNTDQKRVNPLVLARYYEDNPYVNPVLIDYTDVRQLIVTNFRSLITQNQNVHPTNNIDIRLETLTEEDPDVRAIEEAFVERTPTGSKDSFIKDAISTPDPYLNRVVAENLRRQRKGYVSASEEEEDDVDDDDDDDDDEYGRGPRPVSKNLLSSSQVFSSFFDKPLSKEARSRFIDDEASSISSREATPDPSSEEISSVSQRNVDNDVRDVLSDLSGRSTNAMHGSSSSSWSGIAFKSNSSASPMDSRAIPIFDNEKAVNGSGVVSKKTSLFPTISGDGKNHTTSSRSSTIMNNNNSFWVTKSGQRVYIDESNGSGKPMSILRNGNKKRLIRKKDTAKRMERVTNSTGIIISSQPIGQINNTLDVDEDTAEVKDAIIDLSEDEEMVAGIESDPFSTPEEIAMDGVRGDVNPPRPPLATNMKNNRVIVITPNSEEVVVRTPRPISLSYESSNDVVEVVDVRPNRLVAIRNTRAINNYMQNALFPTTNQTSQVVDNLVLDSPDPRPRFVDSETGGPLRPDGSLNDAALNSNVRAGVYHHSGELANRISRARTRGEHLDHLRWSTNTNFRNRWYFRVDPSAFQQTSADSTKDSFQQMDNFVDNVFYGFIPAAGIVNANFMQIAYSDAYFDDYDDDNNPMAIKPSATCSNTLVLTKIEYRVEWKLYAGDVATVRMIIGYYDGEPAGQFYTTIDEIAEDMIGYYGFNIDVCSLRPTDILAKSPIFYLGNIQDLDVPDLFKDPTSVSPIQFSVQNNASPVKVLLDKKYDLNVQAINYDVEVIDTNATYRKSDCGNFSLRGSNFQVRYADHDNDIPIHGNIFVLLVGDYGGGEVQVNMYTRVHYTNI